MWSTQCVQCALVELQSFMVFMYSQNAAWNTSTLLCVTNSLAFLRDGCISFGTSKWCAFFLGMIYLDGLHVLNAELILIAINFCTMLELEGVRQRVCPRKIWNDV